MTSRTIRFAVQNLIGGVSQQPESVRLETQCEVQDDAYSSVVDGLGKRQPTEHIHNFNTDGASFLAGSWGLGATERPWTYWIDISSTERYLVVVNQHLFDGIQVWNAITGARETVTGKNKSAIDTRSKGYIGLPTSGPLGDPFEDLAAVTVGDRSYILNKTVTVKKDETKITDAQRVSVATSGPTLRYLSRSSRRWFIFVRSANFLNKYAVRVNTKIGDQHPVAAHRGKWDPPFENDEDNIAWVKTYSGDGTTYQSGSRNGISYAGWGKKTDFPIYEPAAGNHEGRQIGTVQLADIARQMFSERGEPKLKAAGAATRYPGGIFWVDKDQSVIGNATGWTIDKLLRSVKDALGDSKEAPQIGSVIKLELQWWDETKPQYREAMRIQLVEQGDGTENLITFSDEIPRITQLPMQCEHGQIVKVTGADENDGDAYYVRFEVRDVGFKPSRYPADDLGSGSWVECAASLSKPKLDEFTMPHVLQRVEDASQTSGFRFEFYAPDWAEKDAGDDETNPDPSFVGQAIDDVFLYRNRLGFLSDSRLIMSEADEFENFWRTTVQQLLDSDPIDIDVGHSRVAHLRSAAAIEDSMFLFSDRSQFLLQGDPVLTPRTATVVPSTEYDALDDLKPLATERGVYFAYETSGRSFTQLRYLSRIPNTDSFTAFEATGQVPRFIKGKVLEMTATSLESVLVARTDDANGSHVLYIYKWLDKNDDRLLSSWMRYRLGPDSASTQVLGMQFFDDELYLFMRRKNLSTGADTFHLEKIVFSGQRTRDLELDTTSHTPTGESMAFRCLLDRRITQADCTITYDSANLLTKIELPYLVQTDEDSVLLDMKIVSRPKTDTGPEGEQFDFTHAVSGSGDTAVSVLSVKDEDGSLFASLKTNKTARVFIGQSYTMLYEFSRPALRETTRQNSVHDIKTGRVQLLRGHLSLEDTGHCLMKVLPAETSDGQKVVDRPDRIYTFPFLKTGIGATLLGAVNIRDEVLRFPIRGKPDQIRLVIENDSPYPCNPKSLEFEAIYSRRSKTFRS